MTRAAAVLGRPIAQSLSPVLHRAAYGALGLDWTYEAIDCGVAELPGVLARRATWAGFSCTMPLKHAALGLAASVRPAARDIGAANTLLPGGDEVDGWIADNTDVDGVTGALAAHGVVPSEVTVLGAGGTAQAVLGALARSGVPRCTALVRDRTRATALLATAERLGLTVTVDDLRADAAALGAPLVVSTLPTGAADPLASRAWSADQAVLDVVYAPWPTRLAAGAGHGGATVISGASMLLHQAAAQVELMTHAPAPVEAMRGALLDAVPACGA